VSGWTSDPWERPEDTASRLPRVEDLPVAPEGFDREAVRQAFDAFYRHAAQLDATLRVLESVEAFGRQARDLRADIRALRIASWAPLPAPRPLPTPGYAPARSLRGGGAVVAALPRLALEAAFIVLVAAGAAIAELPLALIVLLVVAAWAIVAVAEFVASSRRATLRPGLLPVPAGAESAAAPAVASAQPEPAQATMIDALPPIAEEAVAEPEPEPDAAAPAMAAESAREAEAAPKPRRRFWRRDAVDEAEDIGAPAEPKHVRVLAPGEEPAARALDPWEEDPNLPEAPPPATDEAALPEAQVAADAEPAPEPIAPFEEPPAEEPEPMPVEPSDEAEVAEPVAEPEPEPVAEPEYAPDPEADVVGDAESAPEPEAEVSGRRWFRRRRAERVAEARDEPPLVEPPPVPDDLAVEPGSEPAGEAAMPDAGGPPEAELPGPEAEVVADAEPAPEPVAPFAEPPAQEPEPMPVESRGEPEVAEPTAEADAEPVAETEAEPEAPRRRFWQRNRRSEAEEHDGAAPAPELYEPRHVRRVDVEPAIDPDRVVVPWEAESPFAAEPKAADTWSPSPEYAASDRVEEPAPETPSRAAESSPAGTGDRGESDEPEPLRLAELDRRFSRSDRLRRGRR
jgi:hypothetical protein